MVTVSVLLFDVMEYTNSDKCLNFSNINMHNNLMFFFTVHHSIDFFKLPT